MQFTSILTIGTMSLSSLWSHCWESNLSMHLSTFKTSVLLIKELHGITAIVGMHFIILLQKLVSLFYSLECKNEC